MGYREAMIISDLDYLDFIPETSACHLNGSGATAMSVFSASAFGSSTYTDTFVNNLATIQPNISFALSYIRVISRASGSNPVSSVSASSFSSASN
ncbi:MAG: hypothetical protein HEQ19_20660 [Gloeotrichia echinulata CP02]|jgi:hypothetical protein|nr:hypothetical protein [Gloeotrichia echinulata DEX184]